jgi:hypothetical protein
MFKYNPNDASNVWPSHDDTGAPILYDATLYNVLDGVSKSSNQPMQTWEIHVFNAEGQQRTIKEYVTAKALFKVKQLADALGKRADFNAGTFKAEDYMGASFMVELSIEDGTEGYDDKNRINKFRNPTGAQPATPAPREKVGAGAAVGGESVFKKDDIPF